MGGCHPHHYPGRGHFAPTLQMSKWGQEPLGSGGSGSAACRALALVPV